jgi:hypothetical protein
MLFQTVWYRCAAQVRDDFGKEVGSKLCHIVGADGGIVPRPVPLPDYGLMTDVAYRWWVIATTVDCNVACFSSAQLYLVAALAAALQG